MAGRGGSGRFRDSHAFLLAGAAAHRREALLLPAAHDGHDLVVTVTPHTQAVVRPAWEEGGCWPPLWPAQASCVPSERRAAPQPRCPSPPRQPPAVPVRSVFMLMTSLQVLQAALRKRGAPQGL